MEINDQEKKIILEKIQVPASPESLIDFIRWLDKEFYKYMGDEPVLLQQILARSVVALGYILIEKLSYETILKTLKAGENYALNPGENTWLEFQKSATISYPFGPGDGCLRIPVELGSKEITPNSSCVPGTGCYSGAGSLACQDIDPAEVMQAITKELVPWILDTGDPVLSRLRNL